MTVSFPPFSPKRSKDERLDRIEHTEQRERGDVPVGTVSPAVPRHRVWRRFAWPGRVRSWGWWRHPRCRAALVALAIVVLLNGLALLFQRPLAARSDTYEGIARVQACERLGRTPDIIYLGSSRTVYGIDPSVVDATLGAQTGQRILSCNAAAIGSTFEQDYYTLKRLLDDGHAPKAVVETLWEWNLNLGSSRQAQAATDHFAEVEHLANLGDLPQIEARIRGNGDHWGNGWNAPEQTVGFLAQKTIPLYGERIGILRTLCGPLRKGPCGIDVSALDGGTRHVYTLAKTLGWVPAPGPAIGQMSAAQIANRQAHDWPYMTGLLQHFRIGGIEPAYLGKLLDLAQRHHIQVALVMPPLSHYFWNYFKGPTSWQTVIGYLQHIAQAHSVAFYDVSRDPTYTNADFMDPQHLSPAGAHVFSRWLAARVIPALLHPGR